MVGSRGFGDIACLRENYLNPVLLAVSGEHGGFNADGATVVAADINGEGLKKVPASSSSHCGCK